MEQSFNVTELDHGDSTSVVLAAESLAESACPQPRYQQLVDAEVVEAMPGMFMVTSRAAVEATFKNNAVFSSEGFLELGNVRPLIPLSVDPPRHLKYRKILDPIFAPKQMDAIEDDVTARVNHFIDEFVDRGECHFTNEFAEPFPSSVFLGLMGLPWEELDTFLRLKDGILRPGSIDMDPEERLQIQRDIGQELYAYFDKILDVRLDDPRDDILTRFNNAEIDGERLTRDEILDICYLFFIAGLDTVTDSLSCFFAFLGAHPDHRRQLVERPELIPSAVEELLRWETPVPNVPRMAKSECPVAGHTIPAGGFVLVNVGAANVDPAEYPDAMEVRFDREVNRHLAFGGGVHRCLGSHLARRELRVTLREWHRRIPDYGIKPGIELQYAPGLRLVENLELVWPAPWTAAVVERPFRGEPALELRAGELRATFVPGLGMTGVSLRRRGREYLALPGGLDALRAGHTAGLPLLAPWANRLGGLRYRAAGVTVDLHGLPLGTDGAGLPIHGLLVGQPGWTVARCGATGAVARIAASVDVDAPAFPFPHRIDVAIAAHEDRLVVDTTVVPTGRRRVPVVFGWHPYLRLPGAPRSQWRLRLPVRRHLALDDRGIPTGASEAARAEADPVGRRHFDDLYALGRSRRLAFAADDGTAIELRSGPTYPYAQVWVPPGRRFAALEPMTAPTDALGRGDAPLVAPGDAFTARFELVPIV